MLDPDARDLLAALTLDEKLSLIHGNSKFTTAAVTRLGIGELVLSDGPHGVREELEPHTWNTARRGDDFVSHLPCLSALASTFNVELAKEYGDVLGAEANGRGKHVILGPGLNIHRGPLNGRHFEYLSEDPHLTARMGVPLVQGIQAQAVAACAKHFAVNNQETERKTIDVEVDERALREIYFPGFEACVKEAGVLTVMGAYNKLRGHWCCQSDALLNQVLKQEWGFQGAVVSDWDAINETLEPALGGLDLEMGSDKCPSYDEYFFAKPLKAALEASKVPLSAIDDKVARILRVMMHTGVLGARRRGRVNTWGHREKARQIAEEAVVLLKNERGFLPLDLDKADSIAVIGDNAIQVHGRGGGSAGVKALYEKTPLDAIVARARQGASIDFAQGYARDASPEQAAKLRALAVRAAKRAQVVVFCGGLTHELDREGFDRPDMKLPFGQDELLAELFDANPRTVVVLITGAPVELGDWHTRVPALLQVCYAGMEAGSAIARVLFGDVNPSGRLPTTYPKKLEDSPAHSVGEFPGKDGVVRYKEGLFVGYRHFDSNRVEPRYAFGHGLSYTRFEYSNLELPARVNPDLSMSVKLAVKNTGSRAGAEVVQLYVRDVESSVPRPLRELKAFAKVTLEPGETKNVELPLAARSFQFYDAEAHTWKAEPGTFEISVGSSSRDLRLNGKTEI
jgi:beta-glucosidase